MTRGIALFVILCATFVVAPLTASAAPITVPTGLNPGDQYRLAFVTSTTRDATSSNIADYNAFVASAANSVPQLVTLGTNWKAIASTSTVDARDNTDTNYLFSVGVPIYHLGDALIASTNADLWDGLLLTRLDRTERGFVQSTFVWTGSNFLGQRVATPLGVTPASAGDSFVNHSPWIQQGSDPRLQGVALPLYAMSDILTVVPEPSSLVLVAVGLVGALLACRRRKAC